MTVLNQRIVSEIESAPEPIQAELLDFIRLHRETRGVHAGIIVRTRDDADPAAFARRIHAAMADAGDPLGQLIRVVRPSS